MTTEETKKRDWAETWAELLMTAMLLLGAFSLLGWRQTIGMWCLLAAFRLQRNFNEWKPER